MDRFVRPGAPVPTVGAVLDEFRRKANKGFQITGTPAEVADELQAVVEGSDVDGIMLEPTFGGPDCFEEFIEHVQPLLRERGMLHGARHGATLRERLSDDPSGRLAPTHPGTRFQPGTTEATNQRKRTP